MSKNWGKQLKRLALTAELALTLFGPICHPPTWPNGPVRTPPGEVEPQVNWNS